MSLFTLLYLILTTFSRFNSFQENHRPHSNHMIKILISSAILQLIKTLLSGEGNVLLTADNVQLCYKLVN